jgi:cysteine-rich repeat protein
MATVDATSSVPFNNLVFTIVIFEFKECDPTTPYYMLATDICYDICPARYYGDSQFLCQPCPLSSYDCYQCNSSGLCTTCSNSTDFRVMNSSTNRCNPMPGYYDEGTNNSTAKPCNSNCKTCITTSIYCTSCNPKFYLIPNECIPCMTNCQVCTSGTSCDTCDPNYAFDSGASACVLTINCSDIAYCTTCNNTNGCTQCVSGYNATNITACSPVCGDGIKLPNEDCDNGNTGNGCNSNCTI